MDTRTGEIFDFKNGKELKTALKNNINLVEVDCNQLCDFREERSGRFFCTANRSQRRKIKCQIKRK